MLAQVENASLGMTRRDVPICQVLSVHIFSPAEPFPVVCRIHLRPIRQGIFGIHLRAMDQDQSPDGLSWSGQNGLDRNLANCWHC